MPRGQITAAKLAQSMDYGALICEIDGNFDDCMRLIQEIGDDPSIYVANSINPFRIEGQKTVAFELMEQRRWSVPDHVVVPGGNLGNSTALGKGFGELLALGLIDRMPKLSVIQAEGAAPFARLFGEMEGSGSLGGCRSPRLHDHRSSSEHSCYRDQDRRARLVEEELARSVALGRTSNYA